MIKKYLDAEGLKYLWSKISLEDYPNNETLIAVLNAIDETKVDKIDGMGLSANNYTDEEKEKLANLDYATDEEIIAMMIEEGIITIPTTENGETASLIVYDDGSAILIRNSLIVDKNGNGTTDANITVDNNNNGTI